MVLKICEKFHNNVSICFQLSEQTRVHGRNGYVQFSEGNNSKNRQTRVTIMCSVLHLIVLFICVKFCENV